MKTIADEAHVSIMTVSLALRNHPRISSATRQKIMGVAEKLGYQPNPMVANLMTHIRSSRPVPYQANLAYLTAFESPTAWQKHPVAYLAYQGMRARAREVGYLVDTFWIREPGLNQHNLSRVLRSRNIQGVILAPLPRVGVLDEFDWSQWSSAALGNSLLSPRIHCVTHHQYHGMWLVLNMLDQKGYKRIGLAMDEWVDDKVDRTFTSCMAGYQVRLPASRRVPIHLRKALDPVPLAAWMKKYKPDVIVGHDGLVYCLQQLGICVPGDVAVAHLGVPSAFDSNVSGLDQSWTLAGASVVDAVVAQINRNERGIPARPQTIMLEGAWVEGKSTPGPAR
ncbi:MAG: LacI family DNA-binding transcriptional regulator [Candidatus Methylacidiphilales bacterium]|nr:LacI family DNA-binding transcriptional regulator [Candidatus Methylacidiphilales bacterium]